MTTKKPTKKKPVAKKVAAKKPAAKKVAELTLFEKDIMAKIAKMYKDGYKVQVQCDGRTKLANQGEDLLEYLRANNVYQIVGFKSGSPALAYQVK